jgi:hypothetical protein
MVTSDFLERTLVFEVPKETFNKLSFYFGVKCDVDLSPLLTVVAGKELNTRVVQQEIAEYETAIKIWEQFSDAYDGDTGVDCFDSWCRARIKDKSAIRGAAGNSPAEYGTPNNGNTQAVELK